MQVTWDYFHYGYPDDLDIFSPEFIERFVAFSRALTEYLTVELHVRSLFVRSMRSLSFPGQRPMSGTFYPGVRRRGPELKRQLVRAGIASSRAIKSMVPDATILFTDPAIHVVTKDPTPSKLRAAEAYRLAQFEGFDMLLGRCEEELGGGPEVMDVSASITTSTTNGITPTAESCRLVTRSIAR